MPRRKRLISVMFALVGILTVLTMFGVSSWGLKAGTPIVPAAVAMSFPTPPPQSIADVTNVESHRVIIAQYKEQKKKEKKITIAPPKQRPPDFTQATRKLCQNRCAGNQTQCYRRESPGPFYRCQSQYRRCMSSCR